MKRPPFKPSDHGFDMRPDQFRALVAKAFDYFDTRHDRLTVDELLLNPRHAIAFCDAFRRSSACSSLEDHEILRALLNHRKAKHGPRKND
jgi:hypothetical protein